GFEIEIDFVGLDLQNGLALLHRLARFLVPADHLPLGHRVAHLGHDDVGHCLYITCLTARTMSSSCGVAINSRLRAYGIGTSSPVTRTTGASSSSNICSVMLAAISAPAPNGFHCSCTTIARCVFATDA